MRKWIYKSMSDEALMAAYAKGQTAAFECLYLRYKPKLFCFLRRQCANHAIAEDLTHDTWLAVINQANVYQAKAKFSTWIYRIAHNRLIDYWRKHGSSSRMLVEEINEQISDGQDSTLRSVEINELISALKALSGEQVATLLLKIEGFSHAEIAHITSTKQETVKSRLRYAAQHLRASMEVQA